MNPSKSKKFEVLTFIEKLGPVLALVFLVLLVTVMNPSFLEINNI